jgi:hypothetical protein
MPSSIVPYASLELRKTSNDSFAYCFLVLNIRFSHVVMEPWLLEDPEYYGIITNANKKIDRLKRFVF